jgi:hypothetical protein
MKKSLLSIALSSAIVGGVFGQLNQPKLFQGFTKEKPMIDAQFTAKVPGEVVWENGLNVQSDWTIGAADLQGQWQWVTTTPAQLSQYIGAMASSTASNGFAAFNGVQFLLAGSVNSQNATFTYNESLDFSDQSDLLFSFEQRYRAFNTDETWIEFSTDGGTSWSGFQVNQAVVTNDPAVQNTVTVNVSSIVGGQSNVRFRFRWFNPSEDNNFGSGYGWMVDDVKFTSLPDNDITTEALYFGTLGVPYYVIPLQQVAPIDFSVTATNTGSNTQTGVRLQASVASASYTGTSAAVAIAPTMFEELEVTNSFTPTAVGSYTVDFSIVNDSIDDDPTNNVMNSYQFTVGNHIYARDRNTAQGSYGGQPIEGGNLFDIFQNQTLTGIDVRFGATMGSGDQIFGYLYEVNDDFEFIAETQELISAPSLANSFTTLVFSDAIPLVAGKIYMVSVGSLSDEFSIATSGTSVPQTTFIYGDLGSAGIDWYWAPSTVMVRMNFDPTLNINNVEGGKIPFAMYPNPTNGSVTLDYNTLTTDEITISVLDITGKVVYTKVNNNGIVGGQSEVLNLSSLGAGAYYVTLSSTEGTTTMKLIKE